ncbi:hypothetical protein PUNSTDRAFT_123214 [Punctularia strigosozonata HHB-11173 SS5]|uniref:Uncharacterized protein n=1 Tax=Punctularia strigosozonata (strain HHB-11173) TaxID=741275 RepID=R7S055_PUNST|nr:uncharacterized protein PUNSTDRAFT_123214 [Punctularia strigosozonata HHB-11173 SS5]EIN03623.1 hypothetical protein PUNSTDRAFT_123214 [Punctularia strigosozonata HHB-11173 SS5]
MIVRNPSAFRSRLYSSGSSRRVYQGLIEPSPHRVYLSAMGEVGIMWAAARQTATAR